MYMLVFPSVAAFGAGRILGLDAFVEKYEVDGQPPTEKYPILDYILGGVGFFGFFDGQERFIFRHGRDHCPAAYSTLYGMR